MSEYNPPGDDCNRRDFNRLTIAAVSGLLASGGGIWRSLSSLRMRRISSLSFGLPGTNAFAVVAAWRSSNRRSAFRVFLSGPWQAKQCSERIGRISRLNRSLSAALADVARRIAAQTARNSERGANTIRWDAGRRTQENIDTTLDEMIGRFLSDPTKRKAV